MFGLSVVDIAGRQLYTFMTESIRVTYMRESFLCRNGYGEENRDLHTRLST